MNEDHKRRSGSRKKPPSTVLKKPPSRLVVSAEELERFGTLLPNANKRDFVTFLKLFNSYNHSIIPRRRLLCKQRPKLLSVKKMESFLGAFSLHHLENIIETWKKIPNCLDPKELKLYERRAKFAREEGEPFIEKFRTKLQNSPWVLAKNKNKKKGASDKKQDLNAFENISSTVTSSRESKNSAMSELASPADIMMPSAPPASPFLIENSDHFFSPFNREDLLENELPFTPQLGNFSSEGGGISTQQPEKGISSLSSQPGHSSIKDWDPFSPASSENFPENNFPFTPQVGNFDVKVRNIPTQQPGNSTSSLSLQPAQNSTEKSNYSSSDASIIDLTQDDLPSASQPKNFNSAAKKTLLQHFEEKTSSLSSQATHDSVGVCSLDTKKPPTERKQETTSRQTVFSSLMLNDAKTFISLPQTARRDINEVLKLPTFPFIFREYLFQLWRDFTNKNMDLQEKLLSGAINAQEMEERIAPDKELLSQMDAMRKMLVDVVKPAGFECLIIPPSNSLPTPGPIPRPSLGSSPVQALAPTLSPIPVQTSAPTPAPMIPLQISAPTSAPISVQISGPTLGPVPVQTLVPTLNPIPTPTPTITLGSLIVETSPTAIPHNESSSTVLGKGSREARLGQYGDRQKNKQQKLDSSVGHTSSFFNQRNSQPPPLYLQILQNFGQNHVMPNPSIRSEFHSVPPPPFPFEVNQPPISSNMPITPIPQRIATVVDFFNRKRNHTLSIEENNMNTSPVVEKKGPS